MAYEKPEIRTLSARTLVEALGPASALQSGGGVSGSDYQPDQVKPAILPARPWN